MKKTFILLFLLVNFVVISPAFAQKYSENAIAHYVKMTPSEAEKDISTLVRYLTKPFKNNDYYKAQAIAYWIASRIHYDSFYYTEGSATNLIKTYRPSRPAEIIKSRTGICSDFANLFTAMCNRASVRSKVLTGYAYSSRTRLSGRNRSNAAHAWNCFYANGNRYIVDTTFMAGGALDVRGSISSTNHNRALRKMKRRARSGNIKNKFDTYYFDFDYDDEERKRGYIHKER